MLNSVWIIVSTIVIGVTSNLLTPYVGKLLANISNSAKKRNELKKITFENTVKYTIDNPHEEIVLRIRYLQRSIVSFISLLIGLVFMLTNNILLVIFGVIFSFLGYYGFSKSEKLGKVIERVVKHKDLTRPDIDLK